MGYNLCKASISIIFFTKLQKISVQKESRQKTFSRLLLLLYMNSSTGTKGTVNTPRIFHTHVRTYLTNERKCACV